MSRKSHQNGDPKEVLNEIAGLRYFLPRRHFWGFFLAIFCMGLWSSLGASWAALGFLEALLGGLWTQKRVKTRGFLRCLKRLFKAHDGPLGLILPSLADLVPKWAPIKCPKMLTKGTKNCPRFLFFTFLGTLLKSYLENIQDNFWDPKWTRVFAKKSKKIYKRNQDEPKRAIISFKESFQKP